MTLRDITIFAVGRGFSCIAEKGLRVGLDVFENEPAASAKDFPQTDLAALSTCTPHIGASTDEASEAVAEEVVRIVDTFLKTGMPAGVVNVCKQSPAVCSLVVRQKNQVGILADVLDAIRAEKINVLEVSNTLFDGAKAACCSILLEQVPSKDLLAALEAKDEIISVMVNRR